MNRTSRPHGSERALPRLFLFFVFRCFDLSAMGVSTCALLAALAMTFGAVLGKGPAQGPAESCQPEKMTVYRMVLHTFWTRDKFPKHYPDWRPPAQWSKVYGQFFIYFFNYFLSIDVTVWVWKWMRFVWKLFRIKKIEYIKLYDCIFFFIEISEILSFHIIF